MAASYPSAVKTFTSPAATDKMNNPSHATQHSDANAEITAIETELGVTPKGAYATVAAAIATHGTQITTLQTQATASLSTLVSVNFAGSSTALERAYICVPFAVTAIAGYGVVNSGTTGTGASVVVSVTNTAGGTMLSGSFTSAGTAGAQVLTLSAGGTSTLAALGVLCVTKASCATAYGATISFYLTKTAI